MTSPPVSLRSACPFSACGEGAARRVSAERGEVNQRRRAAPQQEQPEPTLRVWTPSALWPIARSLAQPFHQRGSHPFALGQPTRLQAQRQIEPVGAARIVAQNRAQHARGSLDVAQVIGQRHRLPEG